MVVWMLTNSYHEQLCYPDSNVSCIRAQYSVGAQVGLYLVLSLNILVNMIGNSVVILSIAHFKQLHSPTNSLVLSLAVVDLLVGVTIVPFSMTRTVQGCWFYGETFCELHTSTDMLLCSVSICHIICIAVDRYEAVCNPLRYTNNITMPVAWLMVLACWLLAALHSYGLIYSKANFIGPNSYLESTYCLGSCGLSFSSLLAAIDVAVFFILPCTIIVGLYMRIFLVAKEHVKLIRDMNQCFDANGGLSKRSEHKAAKTLGIVVGVYMFCWMPFFVDIIIQSNTDLRIPATLTEVFFWLPYVNSTVNPIIYALFYHWFRKCCRQIFTLKILNHNSSDSNVLSI